MENRVRATKDCRSKQSERSERCQMTRRIRWHLPKRQKRETTIAAIKEDILNDSSRSRDPDLEQVHNFYASIR